MENAAVISTVRTMLADDKGFLAMDESIPTCNKRFEKYGIPQTEETRRAYRELLVTTPDLNQCISSAILCDETIRQNTKAGIALLSVLVQEGIIPGIKVDHGTREMAGHESEKVTEGLDGLRQRLTEYSQMGARFAKWRAVISIKNELPSQACIETNMQILARYASLCQEAGLVPIVEPEVLMEGEHDLSRCYDVTETVQRTLFEQLNAQGVLLEGLILKPNMVLAGLDCKIQPSDQVVADATVTCLLRSVPAAVPGIAFLSGGQSPELASARLNAMTDAVNSQFKAMIPWALTFSFARALQEPALELWAGDPLKTGAAQSALLHRARCNRAARQGRYSPTMEAR